MTNQPSAGDLLRAYYAALDAPSLDALDELLAPDCEWLFPGTALRGPAAVKESMARSLALGLSMRHDISHLVEQGDVAICELVATNELPGASYTVAGAVVCERAGDHIGRLAAYPDAESMGRFIAGLRERARAQRNG